MASNMFPIHDSNVKGQSVGLHLSELLIEFGGVQFRWRQDVLRLWQIKDLDALLSSPHRRPCLLIIGGILAGLLQEQTQKNVHSQLQTQIQMCEKLHFCEFSLIFVK